ncbi:MAG: YbaN family protein [Lentisphaeraceae bacterium]|nr:YbaN family protein [Lentisphaeraceae bacterium]
MKTKLVKSKALRILLMTSGFISVGLGIVGAVLPVLPTTPFLILAAICFSYSSERFYKRIINNKYFGKNVKDYLEGRGIPMKAKIAAISVLWISIGVSSWFVPVFWVKVLLPSLALFITWFILNEPTSN